MSDRLLLSNAIASEGRVSKSVTYFSGLPYDRGLAHGRCWAAEIHRILDSYARDARHPWSRLPDIGKFLRQVDRMFDQEAREELCGIADGAGVEWRQLAAHDLYLFCEWMGAGCSQFAVTAAGNPGGRMLHGSNVDVLARLLDRQAFQPMAVGCSAPGRLSYVTVLVPGVLCGIGGVNSCGVAVSSAALLDQVDPAAPAAGFRHSVTVRRLLSEAEDVDAAVAILRSQPKYGAWSVCLTHAAQDRLIWVEYRDNEVRIERSQSRICGSNHALLFPARRPAPEHSVHRRNRLRDLLHKPQGLDAEVARRGLRDQFDLGRGRETRFPTMNTVRRVDNLLSALWEPAAQILWLATAAPSASVAPVSEPFRQLAMAEVLPSDAAARSSQAVACPRVARSTASVEPLIAADRLRAAWDAVRPSGSEGEGDLCRRFVLRLAACRDVPAGPLPTPGSRVLIAGDGPVADALAARIQGGGGTVVRLNLTATLSAAAVERVDQAWQAGPLPWLFLIAAGGPVESCPPTAGVGDSRQQSRVMKFFLICQRWYQHLAAAGQLDQATLVASLALGGDYGLSRQIEAIESGALTGLLKGVRRESAELQRAQPQVKLVDAPRAMTHEALADRLWAEAFSRDGLVEVAYREGRRYALCGVPEEPGSTPSSGVLPAGNWLITGGARGVTAVVARALGQRFGLTLQLIGSRPLAELDPSWRARAAADPKGLRAEILRLARQRGEVPVQAGDRVEKALEIERNLARLTEAGVRYVYHACDVADRQGLAATLEAIRAADGPLDGILHGAGVEYACKFERKTEDRVWQTIRIKAGAAATLLELTCDDPLRHVVGFGSISGRWGSVGQTDYCAANDLLAKLLAQQQERRPGCRHLCFHWPAWDEVGMAARPESRLMLEQAGLRFMSPREGADHVIRELSACATDTEIVIDDPQHSRQHCERVLQ